MQMPQSLLNFLDGLCRQDADDLAQWFDETPNADVAAVNAIRAKMQRHAPQRCTGRLDGPRKTIEGRRA